LLKELLLLPSAIRYIMKSKITEPAMKGDLGVKTGKGFYEYKKD